MRSITIVVIESDTRLSPFTELISVARWYTLANLYAVSLMASGIEGAVTERDESITFVADEFGWELDLELKGGKSMNDCIRFSVRPGDWSETAEYRRVVFDQSMRIATTLRRLFAMPVQINAVPDWA